MQIENLLPVVNFGISQAAPLQLGEEQLLFGAHPRAQDANTHKGFLWQIALLVRQRRLLATALASTSSANGRLASTRSANGRFRQAQPTDGRLSLSKPACIPEDFVARLITPSANRTSAYSPQSSSTSGARANVGGSRLTTSSSAPQSGQATISLASVSAARVTSAAHSGQLAVTTGSFWFDAKPQRRKVSAGDPSSSFASSRLCVSFF